MLFTIMRFWRNLRQPRKRILKRQWKQFKQMLDYTYNTVPFYKAKLTKVGITPADIKTYDDLLKIPVITKDEIRKAGRRLVAIPYQEKQLMESNTSGSTGQATTTYFDKRSWFLLKHFLKLRSKHFCGLRYGDRLAIMEDEKTDKLEEENRKALNRLLRKRYVSIYETLDTTLKVFKKYKPTVLYGMPSYFIELMEHVRKHNIKWLKPRLIFLSSELVDPMTKRELEKTFNCTVHDIYGSTEFKEVAWECKLKQYHVNADSYLVEFVNKGKHVAHEKEGDIIITSLLNRAMPLIRYSLGDKGSPRYGVCECGCTFPIMKPVLGRSVDYIRLGDGRSIAPFFCTNAVKKAAKREVDQFQIVQVKPNELVINVKPNKRFTKKVEQAIIAAFQEELGKKVKITVKRVKSIPREKSGKYKIVKSLIR